MKCEDIKERMPDFLTGDLDKKAKSEFDAHIARCSACGEELRQMSEIWTKLGVLPMEQPSPALRNRFYTMLEAYKESFEADKAAAVPKKKLSFSFGRIWPRRPAFQFAAALVFVVLGITAGYLLRNPKAQMSQLHQEVDSMRQIMAVSLLQQPSSSDRIQGASFSSQVKAPTQKTLDTLLQTLNNDPNVNVRLAAVDALYLFSAYPEVKDSIVQSLTKQESPLIQVALIDLLVGIREKRAVEAFKTLIQNEKLNPDVKQKAQLGIQQLSF
jgi:anti-sigma factor RsiW